MKFWEYGEDVTKRDAKRSETRIVVIFLILAIGILIAILSLYVASSTEAYRQAAVQQSTYTLEIASARGTIYDTNLRPMVNQSLQTVASVAPMPEAAGALADVFPTEYMQSTYERLAQGTPFWITVPDNITLSEKQGVDLFSVPTRYADTPTAVHVIGYTDAEGNGISGLEKSFDHVLKAYSGTAQIQYRVDAVNHVISFDEREITDTLDYSKGGLVLTLDTEIQKVAEDASGLYLEQGAIVVTEVETGKIRALVSAPAFDPNDVAAAMEREDAPLINRALSAYSVGSVFKLVAAAAALESGISENREYTCTGGYEVSGAVFHCFDEVAHGTVDMEAAISESCNGYFIDMMQSVPVDSFLQMAQTLGFGSPMQLAEGYASASGILPSIDSLSVPRALANFSFGQGELTATPIQIAALTNTIASDGIYRPLTITEGVLDEEGNMEEIFPIGDAKQVMRISTAQLLKEFMRTAVEEGTATAGKPVIGGAGAKTGTAQTGMFQDGEEVLALWYTGFFPFASPKYSITVLADGMNAQDASPCAQIFKYIADRLL